MFVSTRIVISTAYFAAVAVLLLALVAGNAEAVSNEIIFSPVGENTNDAFGYSSANAGDVNGDGYPDLIVGAREYPSGPSRGRAYIYFGGPEADDVPDVVLTGENFGDSFGNTVDGAGDVNADGYDDVIVGAIISYTGRAYVYFGGPTPDSVADLVVMGTANSHLSIPVAGAGDVNGDGYDDFLVGASGAGPAGEGQVYLFFGGPSVDNTPDLTFTGVAAGDDFGNAVDVGDIDGDGFNDIVIGARFNDFDGPDAGSAYLYYGGPGINNTFDVHFHGYTDYFGYALKTVDMNGDGYDDILISNAFDTGTVILYHGGPHIDWLAEDVFAGPSDGDSFGSRLGNAGDLNADGIDDFVIADWAYDTGVTNVGRAHVFFGGDQDGSADLVFTGNDQIRFGISVDGAGDFNGDGVDELLIGAEEGYNDAYVQTGRIYVYSLFPYRVQSPNGGERWIAGSTATVRWKGHDPADVSLSLDGGLSWSTLLTGVGGNATNQASVHVPSMATGTALVRLTYTGQSPSASNSDVSDSVFEIVNPIRSPAAHAFRFSSTGEAANDRFGNVVAGAGDVNADGFEDIIVGALNNGAGGAGAGRAYVFFGGPGSGAGPDLTLTGEAAGDSFGGSVAGAGDINGDGYDDFLVGAGLNDAGGNLAGRVYLYYGGPGVDGTADLIYTGTAANYRLGFEVAGAGDVNDDGYDDVLVGGNFAGAGTEGRVDVYYGGVTPDATADLVIAGEASNDQMGSALVGGIDLNQDGIDDFAVSSRLNEAGGSDRGRVYVFFGGPALDTTPDRVINGEVNYENLGYQLAGGDVNGDGVDDLVASAWGYNPGGVPDQGRILVYFGGAEFDAVPDLIMHGEASSDRFGSGLAVGDLTGDEAADIVVGAYQHDTGGTTAGRTYVFHGGLELDAQADLTLDGMEGGDWFGLSVGTADLDNDGFSDIVVGADDGGSGGADPGRVFVYDCNRYIVLSPAAGDIWNVGAEETIEWLGAETADLWLSVDGGNSYSLLESAVGGSGINAYPLTVPHQPTRFAKIKVTPTDPGVNGGGPSDSLFTIEASISMLMLSAQPGLGGGVLLSWNTDPGPEDLGGYKIERARVADTWEILESLTRETEYLDPTGGPGMRYRLSAINGLGQEIFLGETGIAPRAALSAWPLPYRGGDLSIAFATFGGRGGGVGSAEVGLFDLNGRLVKMLARGEYAAGQQTISWDGTDTSGRNVASGIYFLRSNTAGESSAMRLVVVR